MEERGKQPGEEKVRRSAQGETIVHLKEIEACVFMTCSDKRINERRIKQVVMAHTLVTLFSSVRSSRLSCVVRAPHPWRRASGAWPCVCVIIECWSSRH